MLTTIVLFIHRRQGSNNAQHDTSSLLTSAIPPRMIFWAFAVKGESSALHTLTCHGSGFPAFRVAFASGLLEGQEKPRVSVPTFKRDRLLCQGTETIEFSLPTTSENPLWWVYSRSGCRWGAPVEQNTPFR